MPQTFCKPEVIHFVICTVFKMFSEINSFGGYTLKIHSPAPITHRGQGGDSSHPATHTMPVTLSQAVGFSETDATVTDSFWAMVSIWILKADLVPKVWLCHSLSGNNLVHA